MNNAIVLSSLFPLARGMFRFGDADGIIGRKSAASRRRGWRSTASQDNLSSMFSVPYSYDF